AYYIARPKDNFSKVAKLIYGDEGRAGELKQVNPGVKPRIGDKIYYNSPVRPDDESTMKSYYEDAGLPAEVYVAQEGDNLRKVAKDLLGYSSAWKEIYATNPVDSTRKLEAGTELRYWR